MLKNLKFFHLFIWGKKSPENASHVILQRKNAFLDYKNKNLIKSKNKHSFKGVGPCFWSKIWNFASLYLWENSPGICVSRHFRKEERLFRLQKQKVKKDEKIRIFPKGIVHVFGQKFENFPSFYSRQNRPE